MATKRISNKSVASLTCPAGKDRVILWDDALAGFGVAAFPSGKKVYVVQYRQNGRSRRMTVAVHGRKTEKEARSMAKKILGSVEEGIDPIEQKRAAGRQRPFRDVAEDWMREHVQARRKGTTEAEYRSLLDRYIIPELGSKRISEIRRPDVMRMHTKLSSRSGEAQDGGKRVARPIRANRCLAVISSIWNWAEKRDEVPAGSNPAMGVERNTEKSRERYLSSEELKRLGNALHRAETVGLPWNLDPAKPTSKHHRKGPKLTKVDLYAVAAIRLLVLTGARLREILTAKWEWIDWERGMIMLPDSKTGAKPIFLNSAAIDILKGLPRIAANPYIIPGMGERINKGEPKKKPKPAPRADLKRPWDAVSRAAGLDGVRIHDLRHTHAATGAGAGLGLQMVGKLLGHSQPQTTQRYAHLDADPIKRASNIIGDKLAEAMNGPGPRPLKKVG